MELQTDGPSPSQNLYRVDGGSKVEMVRQSEDFDEEEERQSD